MALTDNVLKHHRTPFSVNSLMCHIISNTFLYTKKRHIGVVIIKIGSNRVYRNTLKAPLIAAWFPI